MFRRLFLDHPASVGETYSQHFGVASRVGVRMIGGGLAALVHAVLPFAFPTTGSRTIRQLHRDLFKAREAEAEKRSAEYII